MTRSLTPFRTRRLRPLPVTIAHAFAAAAARVAVAVAVAVAVVVFVVGVAVATGTTGSVAIAAADPIEVVQGVTLTPAPGWTAGDRGPDWVALTNADGSARIRVEVTQAGWTDVVAALKADVDQYSVSSPLMNVSDVSAPTPTSQGGKFPQQASIDYTGGVSGPLGTAPVHGTFTELLSIASGLSVFIDFQQNNNATPQAAADSAAMINSML